MKAKKTKTGQWTCCAYYRDAEGKIRRPRFTGERRSDVERAAAAFSLEHKNDYKLAQEGLLPISFKEAAEKYIKNREAVLSPSTIREYTRSLRSYDLINGINVYDLTREQIQALVNSWAATLSPKTIRNLHGFLSSVLKAYRPDFIPYSVMPQSIKPNLYTPTDAEIQKLMKAVKGTRLEAPVMLAALSSLRRSEICALTISDIGDGWIRVNKAMVQDKNKKWVIKSTKTEAGTRITYLPKQATDRIKRIANGTRVTDMNPTMITSSFSKVLKKNNIQHFRFHALRSYYASALHALGVPDKYIMEWGGWHDQQTLQDHYQKALPDKVPAFAAKGIEHFGKLLP